MADITTEGQELQKNDDSDNNPTEDDGATITKTHKVQPAFTEICNNLTKSETSATAGEEALPTTTTLDDAAVTGGTSTVSPPEEISHPDETEITAAPTPSMQDEMEVENNTEPPSGPALLTPSIQVAVGESGSSNNAITSGGGGSMEVVPQTREEDPNAISCIEMKIEEAPRSLLEETAGKMETEEHYDGESRGIESSNCSAALGRRMTNMVMEKPPQGSDAITTIIYEGKVGISRGGGGWVLHSFA